VVLVTVAAVVATTAGVAAQGRLLISRVEFKPNILRSRKAEGSRLVLLVRARRPIDGWGGPVAGTRLVSVRTAR
jgi:hypothetical protein